MGFNKLRNEFEEFLGEKSSDENNIAGDFVMDMSVGVEGVYGNCDFEVVGMFEGSN